MNIVHKNYINYYHVSAHKMTNEQSLKTLFLNKIRKENLVHRTKEELLVSKYIKSNRYAKILKPINSGE